jgi:hypothetical protein
MEQLALPVLLVLLVLPVLLAHKAPLVLQAQLVLRVLLAPLIKWWEVSEHIAPPIRWRVTAHG